MHYLDVADFPSFSEGLSLRVPSVGLEQQRHPDFPSFSEGLSLRVKQKMQNLSQKLTFPFLFGGTFIEGGITLRQWRHVW